MARYSIALGRGVWYCSAPFSNVFGLMMMSLSADYYQFLLAQSICSGMALYHAATNAVSTWFLKKRGKALGIIASGSSMGDLIVP